MKTYTRIVLICMIIVFMAGFENSLGECGNKIIHNSPENKKMTGLKALNNGNGTNMWDVTGSNNKNIDPTKTGVLHGISPFTENHGQIKNETVRFYLTTSGRSIFVTDTGLVLDFYTKQKKKTKGVPGDRFVEYKKNRDCYQGSICWFTTIHDKR